jgi:hypothetical protein
VQVFEDFGAEDGAGARVAFCQKRTELGVGGDDGGFVGFEVGVGEVVKQALVGGGDGRGIGVVFMRRGGMLVGFPFDDVEEALPVEFAAAEEVAVDDFFDEAIIGVEVFEAAVEEVELRLGERGVELFEPLGHDAGAFGVHIRTSTLPRVG